MLSLFKSKQQPRAGKQNSKRAARNAKQREYYNDPLPLPPPAPQFNIFIPSTYAKLFHPSSPSTSYRGIWCPETRSVNITSDVDGVEIWRRGMWGKGTLSRSQPAWRERKTKEMSGERHLSLEELTALKRKERAEFKEERVKKERLDREKQLREEAAKMNGEAIVEEEVTQGTQPKRKRRKMVTTVTIEDKPVYSEEYLDKEILQLAPEEALFLLQLNLLTIEYDNTPISLRQFLHLISTTSRPDDPFLIHYIVYYHFRRQRIIVKPGLKFGVDYLLYDRPIPLAHAQHCVNVLGNYHLWEDVGERLIREEITWQQVNLWQRLMGNVRKRLKYVYVEIPPIKEGDWRDVNSREEFEEVLQRYRVREVMNSRMVIARERDVKPDK